VIFQFGKDLWKSFIVRQALSEHEGVAEKGDRRAALGGNGLTQKIIIDGICCIVDGLARLGIDLLGAETSRCTRAPAKDRL
jgi:hypothetical protein